jgi:hypothetical protein
MYQFNEYASIAHLSYNSFQSKYEKRYGNGLALKGAFTWSKDIDVGCADFWEACSIQNQYNLRAERADSPLNVPIVVTASAVYKLPLGKGAKYVNTGLPAAVVGGWQTNGILSSHNGTVYTPGINFDNANSGRGSQRPNKVAPEYTFGNTGRNSLRGPSFTNLDASIFRNFTIFRESSFQFRAEFFNILNHTNLGNPDGNLQSGTYGKIRYQNGSSRQIQFAGKINF